MKAYVLPERCLSASSIVESDEGAGVVVASD
jgi:hypothetical protein